MNCQAAQKLLHAYADGELDVLKNLEIEEHLQECSACARAQQSIQALRTSIRNEAGYHKLPAAVQARIRSAVLRASQERPTVASRSLVWLAAAAAAVLIAIVTRSLWLSPRLGPGEPAMAEQLLACHVRSQMLSSHLVDVTSSDRHTVKPWFKGKLDFSPDVPDLASQGFELVGGRLDYIDQRPVAVLVYQRRKHIINLFIWPNRQDISSTSANLTLQGYHLASWNQSGMTYWVVSDLNKSELGDFIAMIKQAPS